MGTSKKHILVVDDDECIRELLLAALDAAGYDAVAADDRQALQTVYAHPPLMILLDLMMPTITGEEICRQVRAQPATATIPIVAMSAGWDPAAIMELGIFNDYLPKPFSLRMLSHIVECWAFTPRDRVTGSLVLPGREAPTCHFHRTV